MLLKRLLGKIKSGDATSEMLEPSRPEPVGYDYYSDPYGYVYYCKNDQPIRDENGKHMTYKEHGRPRARSNDKLLVS